MIIETLTPDGYAAALDDMAAVLQDAVASGASVGFVMPFTVAEARDFWAAFSGQVAAGTRLVTVARDAAGRIVGTVFVNLATPKNQPHRADLGKLLVHRDARGQGLARRLMAAAEAGALQAGKTLITLDTRTGDPAEGLYERLGYVRMGVIPRYTVDGDCAFFYKHMA
ncbi:MAG: GNAT family N-acetyltransferase [Alphaproteobacteria bacterium]|jgi:ribosomal protein S18 acetylase RimI-like enzyme|nr:GNAT family N-acetyltransferase [Alphaproteobacteria bacterium]